MSDNNLRTWRAIACKRVPMVAAILHACAYHEMTDEEMNKALPNPGGTQTFCVNPDTLDVYYSSDFTSKNTPEQNAFALAHEGAHVLCNHVVRRLAMKEREASAFIFPLWMMAEEQAVNQLVASTGGWGSVPINGLIECPSEHQMLTTEEIYYKLKKSCKVVKINCHCMHPDANGKGDAESSAADIVKSQALQAGRKVALEENRGKEAGNLPGELKEMIASFNPLSKPPDFRELLLRYMTSMTAACNSFDEATIYRNRVLLDGLCVPNLANKPQAARFAASIDNSGSVDEAAFSLLKSVLIEAADQLGFSEIVVQHFTTQVMATERYTDLNKLKLFKRKADGGTALEDADMKARKANAVFNIILTDGYVSWLPQYSVPTVIVRTDGSTQPPPRVRNMIADIVLK